MLLTFENLSRILRLEPASQPQNLRAEPQKLERVTPRSILDGRPRYPALAENFMTRMLTCGLFAVANHYFCFIQNFST